MPRISHTQGTVKKLETLNILTPVLHLACLRNIHKPYILYYLKLITHIRRIIPPVAHMPCRLHIRRSGRIIFRDTAFFVAAEGVAAQVGVLGVEGGAGSFGEFGCCLSLDLVAFHSYGVEFSGLDEGDGILTLMSPQTKFNGNPYLNTVSTNTLNASTCIQAMTLSPHAVLPSLNASPHTFFSSLATLSSSLLSSSFPPSLYLKSLGVHFDSRHLWMKSWEYFLNVVTA